MRDVFSSDIQKPFPPFNSNKQFVSIQRKDSAQDTSKSGILLPGVAFSSETCRLPDLVLFIVVHWDTGFSRFFIAPRSSLKLDSQVLLQGGRHMHGVRE